MQHIIGTVNMNAPAWGDTTLEEEHDGKVPGINGSGGGSVSVGRVEACTCSVVVEWYAGPGPFTMQ